MICAVAEGAGAAARIRRSAGRSGLRDFGIFVIMDWTLFDFIETMTNAATFAVPNTALLMMHEDCGMTQNYVGEDVGEAVEKRISPLRCSR